MWMASRLNRASPNSNKGGRLYHCHSLLVLPYPLWVGGACSVSFLVWLTACHQSYRLPFLLLLPMLHSSHCSYFPKLISVWFLLSLKWVLWTFTARFMSWADAAVTFSCSFFRLISNLLVIRYIFNEMFKMNNDALIHITQLAGNQKTKSGNWKAFCLKLMHSMYMS